MKKQLLTLLCLAMSLTASAQTAEIFEPYQPIEMRLPSVPLFLNDPYFSYWMPADKLNDRTTAHWTGAVKPMDGLLRVDGKAYRFMGVANESVLFPIMPMAYDEVWTAKTWHEKLTGTDWAQPDFDDSSWASEQGAIGTQKEYDNVHTNWDDLNSDVYARRHVTLTAEDLEKDLFIVYSHDDVFEMYINGTKVASTGETWVQNVKERLGDKKALLHEGDNVIACHCHNTGGGALLDFGLYENHKPENAPFELAEQKSVDVHATNTYYTFTCGPVELDLVFTAPMLMDDPDLLSTPVNYLSYQVRSTDGNAHDVQFYFATSPILAINKTSQPTTTITETTDGVTYLKAGKSGQPADDKMTVGPTGDIICIDWGYLYMPSYNGTVSLAQNTICENHFIHNGTLPESEDKLESNSERTMPVMAYTHNFGSVTEGASFMLIGYDEVKDIQYFGKDYPAYWARNGKSIKTAMQEMYDSYADIMMRCRAQDKVIYDDGLAAGNAKYAEILCATYRHCIAAHKLFEDKDGNMLFFSKENNSNGCVNTVDLTYPSAPLFLLYNPALEKGMITSILDYSKSGRWKRPWAAHDLGTYPKANGQVYGGDMPLEESGNILTLLATITMMDHDMDYINKYWNILTTWTDYLVENGQDPDTQLCTDDFAGHWAHNANLSVKAIMGIAGYALLAQMRGEEDTYNKYMGIARNMASIWVTSCREADHYRLVFRSDDNSDISKTWSQKYNLVWDKLWNLNLFGDRVIDREIKYYLTKQNKYGLPLDSREGYTKSDWICWSASMATEKDDFLKFTDLLWKYGNETRSRVPFSDWFRTGDASSVAFIARSVVGGHWMRILMDRMHDRATYDANKVWAQAPNALNTRYAEQVTPDNVLPEYPRPQMQRSEWMNLNGLWDYTFVRTAASQSDGLFDGQILVPFSLESSISGVKQPMPGNLAIWYERTVEVPQSWEGKSILLHIGAADYRTTIYVNGKPAATANSGYIPMDANITKYIQTGTNTIAVKVEDPTAEGQPVGRQATEKTSNIGEYRHNAVSGIWQTIWMEPVNSAYINSFKYDYDLATSTLTIRTECRGTNENHNVLAIVSDGENEVARGTAAAGQPIVLNIDDPKLWSPAEPTLYNLQMLMREGNAEAVVDETTGYVALRSISVKQDENGTQRILLNGKNLFQAGVMDEGYWPDGLYTAPTDEAIVNDIATAKSLGFNLIRKSQKVEPERYYYHCDRLGMLVWQDVPALGLKTQTLNAAGWFDGTTTIANATRSSYKNFVTSLVPTLYNHPSVVMWTLFDEARGQHDTETLVNLVKNLDGTRLVNASSGGNYVQGVGDVHDLHQATGTRLVVNFTDNTRPMVFGAYGSNVTCAVPNHMWDNSITRGAYNQTQASTLIRNFANGLKTLATSETPVNAGVFAQLYDVETELSGLMTYDREVMKVSETDLATANEALVQALDHLSGITTVGATGQRAVIGCYNINGQAINPATASGLVIVRYSDGTAEKTIVK